MAYMKLKKSLSRNGYRTSRTRFGVGSQHAANLRSASGSWNVYAETRQAAEELSVWWTTAKTILIPMDKLRTKPGTTQLVGGRLFAGKTLESLPNTMIFEVSGFYFPRVQLTHQRQKTALLARRF